jgi:hypothetical protein
MSTTGKDDELDDTAPASESPQGDLDLDARRRELAEIVAHNRASDVDIREVLPDTAAFLKEVGPRRADEKLRDASLTPVPPATAQVSAPSPWAKGAPDTGGIDKAALPSAMRPEAAGGAEADTTHVKPPAPRPPPRRPRASTPKTIGAVIAVFVPLVLMYVLLVRLNETRSGSGIDPTSRASSSATGAPSIAAAPSVQSAAQMPSTAPTTSAAAPPAVTSVPSTAPSATTRPNPRHPEPSPRGGIDDPYDSGTPPPTKTVEPVVPPPPPPKTAEPAAPPPSATATQGPFIIHRKEP